MCDRIKTKMIALAKELTDLESSLDPTSRQVRALFTSICLLNDIEADTSACDNILSEVYSVRKNKAIKYSDFEDFMLSDIV